MIDGVGIAAIIAALAAGIATVIGALRLQGRAADGETKTQDSGVGGVKELPPVPERFDGAEVLDFLKQVRADNVDLRARDLEKDERIRKLQETLDEMNLELKSALEIRDAFARWTPVLFQSWGKSNTPPLPSGEDLITLRDFIPRT